MRVAECTAQRTWRPSLPAASADPIVTICRSSLTEPDQAPLLEAALAISHGCDQVSRDGTDCSGQQ